MTHLPKPPTEIAAVHSTEGLAPKFRDALAAMLLDLTEHGWMPILRETLRSNERAAFLYGFGREYDDGRGVVTNAETALRTWHHFGLAADVGDRRYDSGCEPGKFYADLEACALKHGLTSGADWNRNAIHDEKFCDKPHVQWFCDGMHVSPSDHAAELLASGGVQAVWQALHAQ